MANILDGLIGRIDDPALRADLTREVNLLRDNKRFGLVFERHLPETTRLVGHPVRRGCNVVDRTLPSSPTWLVERVTNKVAHLVGTDSSETQKALDSLAVVAEFGDPVYPGLRSIGRIELGGHKPFHTVVSAENYHALQALQYTCEGKVDCIYIDPPYNTGARDWKYNNNYVDSNDRWGHSKWLSFMEKRLTLARRLLTPDGVLIVTIDEHEVHNLGALLAQLFPGHLRHMVSIVINPKGTGKVNFGRVDEYAFFVIPDTGESLVSLPATALPWQVSSVGKPNGRDIDDDDIDEDVPEEGEENETEPDIDVENSSAASVAGLPFPAGERADWELRHARRRGGESSYRHQRPNQFYPIWVDPEAGVVVRAGSSPKDTTTEPDLRLVAGLKPIWPIDSERNHRCWRFIPDSMQRLIDDQRVVLGRYNKKQDTYTINYWVQRPTEKKPKTVWWETRHDAGTHGTSLLHKLLGDRNAFNFPKSVYSVADCLAMVLRNRPNALVVDFFAGSGTTLHALALLNTVDNGTRRCILVTNNDVDEQTARTLNSQGCYPGDPDYEALGIYQKATVPRVRAALTGRQAGSDVEIKGKYLGGRRIAAGFDENAEFLELVYLDHNGVSRGRSFEAIAPLLWLRAGGVGARIDSESPTFSIASPDGRYAILFDIASWQAFAEALDKHPDITHAFVVTDSLAQYQEVLKTLPTHLDVSMLYEDYLRNFEINTWSIA